MTDTDHRALMLSHIEALDRAMAVTPNAPWAGFLAQRAALVAADEWVRGLHPPPEQANQFGMTVIALLLAVEDVLRLFPDDPKDHPAPKRLAELTVMLLRELRGLLEDPGEPN